VARAVIGTGSSLAPLAFVAREALALAVIAVAKTAARALSVSVASYASIWLAARSVSTVAGRVEVTNLEGIIISSASSKGSLGVIKTLSVGGLQVRRVNEGNLIRADSLGAISRVLSEAETPVVVALANTILSTSSVARASIVTTSLGICQESSENNNSINHLI
jgi:hypothetical protein